MENLTTIIKLKDKIINKLKEAEFNVSDSPYHLHTGQSDVIVVVDTIMEREHYDYNPNVLDSSITSAAKSETNVYIQVYIAGESLIAVQNIQTALSPIKELKLSTINHVTLTQEPDTPIYGYRLGFKVIY